MNGLRIPLRFRARVKSKVPRTFAFSQTPHQDKDIQFQEAHQVAQIEQLDELLEIEGCLGRNREKRGKTAKMLIFSRCSFY